MPLSSVTLPLCQGYRFGQFEVQIGNGLLLREGRRVKLQELPFRILLILLETPGRAISLEEFRTRLWGEDTFIEFESSLRVAVKKLREALGDSAGQSPLYIETIARRGYRFIADVVPVLNLSAQELPEPAPAVPPAITSESVPETESQSADRRWFRIAVPATLGILVIVTASIFLYRYMHRPLIDPQDKVVLGGFTNSTGDRNFDQMLSAALRVKLEESPYLSLLPDSLFQEWIKDPNAAGLAEELRACLSLDGQVLLRGEIRAQSPGYEVLVRAWRCKDGELLTTEKARASSTGNILPALDTAVQRMRRRLGESDRSLQNFNTPLTQVTTNSLAALKALDLGQQELIHGRQGAAIAAYKLAIDLDPQFAVAYARLGMLYRNDGMLSLARQYYQKAFDLRQRATDRERLSITSNYAFVSGDIDSAIEDYKLWRTLYPRDATPANNLAIEYVALGKPEEAVEPARAAVRVAPAEKIPYITLAEAYLYSGNFTELNAMCNDPARENMSASEFHLTCFLAAFAQNDETKMKWQLQWAREEPQRINLLESAGYVALYRGKMQKGNAIFSELRQAAFKQKWPEMAAAADLDEARFTADVGLKKEATQKASDALDVLPNDPAVQALAALALARSSDIARAQSESAKAASESPQDTILNSAELPSIRAAIQLQKGKPEAAIQALEDALSFDFSPDMNLAPAYYRGVAYLQAKRPDDAAKQFQRVLDHRAVVPNSPYIPLAQLELGRSFQLAGDPVDAARAYRETEDIWKNADPDFPPLKQLHVYESQLALQ